VVASVSLSLFLIMMHHALRYRLVPEFGGYLILAGSADAVAFGKGGGGVSPQT
jgi:hypothetical protein